MGTQSRANGLCRTFAVVLMGLAATWGGVFSATAADETVPTAQPRGEVASQHSRDLPELGETSTLSDYLRYAALNNPGLETAFHRWKAAIEKIPQARSLPDPRFTYRYYIEEVETRVGPQRQSAALAQMFPWFGKRRLRGDVAAEAAHASRQRYEARKLVLFYRVKDGYCEYYYLARAIAVVRENRDLIKYLEQVARARYRVGAAGHPSVIRAQVELGKLDDRLRSLEDMRGPLVARLNAALNRPTDAPLPWPKSLPQEAFSAADEEVLRWAGEANPELKALDHEIARQVHAIDLSRKQYFPDITVGLNYIDTGHARMGGTSDSGKDPIVAMVSVNIPLWYSKYRAAEREARHRHLAAARSREERENRLDARIKMVLYRFRDAERKVDLYGDTLVPKAKQSLKATEAAFRADTATFLDLVDAERMLLDFQLSHERGLATRAQRLAELEMLVGRPLSQLGANGED